MAPPPAAPAVAVATDMTPSTVYDGDGCRTSATGADGTAGRSRCETTFLYKEDGPADLDTYEADVIAGLDADVPHIPSKYVYDDTGSGTCRCRCALEWKTK